MIEDVGAPPFDICGPLPQGVTVLEASAGTGKTYAIAGLAARYVAEGTPLQDLLLVTFTRMATGELRERVRERLASVELALRGRRPVAGDPVAEHLARADARLHADRLGRALAGFDAATIATTHGFCQEVLGGLGVAGDVERDYTFVEEVDDLIEEVVGDLYLRRTLVKGTPPFDHREAMRIARLAVALPAAPIEPADATEGSRPAARRAFAEWVRREVDARKRRRALLSYDDLLTRLEAALRDSPAAVARLRERYRVVLVDEFQDTDPVQWAILRRAFAEGGTTLVLIGDPKQAIYAFRGADVYAYLDAAAGAGTRASLETNWRSDQGLIDAHDALFGGARLGHAGIAYRRVSAAPCHVTPRLTGLPDPAPLRVRLVERGQPSILLTRTGLAETASVRAHIAEDLAADVVTLLDSDAVVETRDDDGSTRSRERIDPGHVAVLVRTNRTAAQIRDALERAGVPAVINGAGSVFGTPAAEQWLRLLEALERPASQPRAHAAALTPFVGWTAEELACSDEAAREDVHRRLHEWARILRASGVASLTETITLGQALPARVLALADGERRLTDLRHVAQLLHVAATREQMGVTALTAWLRRRIVEAGQDTSDEERSRRLESDAEAVQVLTVHRSKGLEFPVVYCPDLWEPSRAPDVGEPVAFHDADGTWKIDVGLEGGGFHASRRQSLAERRGEDLRLAYVALTRARHQAVVWWAPTWGSRHAPLTRLLLARDEDGNVRPEGPEVPSDAAAREQFERLAAEAAGGAVSVAASRVGAPVHWSGQPVLAAELAVAGFERRLDRTWRRTSYSDITAAAHEPQVSSEPEEPLLSDEPPVAGPRPAGADGEDGAALRAMPSPLAGMPVGVEVGTFVHRLLEAADFMAPDLEAELGAHAAALQERRRVDVGDTVVAVAGLRAALETPLGPVAGELRLRDVARTDRLDELAFELPLAGGDEPTGRLTIAAIARLLREQAQPGDALAGYAQRLEDPALRSGVRGYLTGSIDLVVRLPGERFAIVDYKTNWLGPPGEELSAWHYRPAALEEEMGRAHYGLQALLYTVALHRYLRWRLPGYRAESNLAGVLYLFLRGMAGAATPRVEGAPCGVFAWRPTGALVEALSDLLDGEEERR